MSPKFTFNFAGRKEVDLKNGDLLTFTLNGNFQTNAYFDLANVSEDEAYLFPMQNVIPIWG